MRVRVHCFRFCGEYFTAALPYEAHPVDVGRQLACVVAARVQDEMHVLQETAARLSQTPLLGAPPSNSNKSIDLPTKKGMISSSYAKGSRPRAAAAMFISRRALCADSGRGVLAIPTM